MAKEITTNPFVKLQTETNHDANVDSDSDSVDTDDASTANAYPVAFDALLVSSFSSSLLFFILLPSDFSCFFRTVPLPGTDSSTLRVADTVGKIGKFPYIKSS